MFTGKKSAQIREILISESAWEEMTCLFAPSLAGLIVTVAVHGIFCPALNLTPPLTQLPFDEYASEILGHIFWFWIIEIMRRDLRNRITHEPDPEVAIR
ncbi:inner membrane protein YagU [Shigella sonnei]|nr:inner membrane protein YagU [Shigella sonnei]